ncbi:MAG: hypothetical protein V4612_02465 [Pseudomonadota bacterium]
MYKGNAQNNPQLKYPVYMDLLIENDEQFAAFEASLNENPNPDQKIYLPKFRNLQHLQKAIEKVGIERIASLDLRELVVKTKEELLKALGIKESENPFLLNLILSPNLRHFFVAIKDDLFLVDELSHLFRRIDEVSKIEKKTSQVVDLVIEKSQKNRDKVMVGNIFSNFLNLQYLRFVDSKGLGFPDLQEKRDRAKKLLRFVSIDQKGDNTNSELANIAPESDTTTIDFTSAALTYVYIDPQKIEYIDSGCDGRRTPKISLDKYRGSGIGSIPDDGFVPELNVLVVGSSLVTAQPMRHQKPQSTLVLELNLVVDAQVESKAKERVEMIILHMHKLYFGDLKNGPEVEEVKQRMNVQEKLLKLRGTSGPEHNLSELFPNCILEIKINGQNPNEVSYIGDEERKRIDQIEAKYVLRHLIQNPQLEISDKLAGLVAAVADKVQETHPELADQIKSLNMLGVQRMLDKQLLLDEAQLRVDEEVSNQNYAFYRHDSRQPMAERAPKRKRDEIDEVVNPQEGRENSPSSSPRSPRSPHSPALDQQASADLGMG